MNSTRKRGVPGGGPAATRFITSDDFEDETMYTVADERFELPYQVPTEEFTCATLNLKLLASREL